MDPVTVFRSADEYAEEDARVITRLLTDAGIAATLLDDSAAGVPQGAWEVQVPAADRERADRFVATHSLDEAREESHALDMVTVFRSAAGGTDAESEALTVRGLLEAAGLMPEIIADARFPNLPEHVQVPRAEAHEARRVIAEALAAGPLAAEEAEAESERSE